MKKKIFTMFIFLICFINSYSQSCGRYKVKIVGVINSKDENFEKIKIPRIRILEYKTESDFDKNEDFMEFKIEKNKVEIETQSSLGAIYGNAETVKKVFKEKNLNLLLILQNGNSERKVYIDWDKIEITKIKNEGSNYYLINLNEVNL